MGKIVKFRASGKAYQLSILDHDGNKWVTAQQLGEALGNTNIHKLVIGLAESGEIIEGKHYSNVRLDCSKGGKPRVLLSYRGVIRVAMRSQGSRAKQFRDWAEDVLYQVMMTGSYGLPRVMELLQAIESGECAVISKRDPIWAKIIETAIRDAVDRSNLVTWPIFQKMRKYRQMGLSQRETAKLLDLSRRTIQKYEAIERAAINFAMIPGGASLQSSIVNRQLTIQEGGAL